MKRKIVTILVHVIAWVIFLSLPYIFRPKVMGPNMMMPDQQEMFLKFLIFNLYLIGLFYIHGYWIMPKFFLKRNWLIYGLILIALFVGFVVLRDFLFARKPPIPFDMLQQPQFNHRPIPQSRFEFQLFKPEPWNAVFLFIVMVLISGGFRIVDEWMKTEKKAKQIENERMTMELSLLRSQINPHFLFNTLNTIYSLALLKSDITADAVMKLSDIMRYMTEDSSSDKVELKKEVDYIRHYTELQRIRLGENTPIHLTMHGEFGGYFIPPLILMPFVENAFKYGISNHEKSGIDISICIEKGTLLLTVSNRIFRDRTTNTNSGLGIRNTQQRLERIYPNQHSLSIVEEGDTYKVSLKIELS